MTVKSKKEEKSFKLPTWFKVSLGIMLLSSMIGFVVYSAIKSQQANRIERQKQADKEYNIKHKDIISRDYPLLCDKTILPKGKYNIVMIDKKFKIVNGGELSTIENTFKERECSVIYIVKEGK